VTVALEIRIAGSDVLESLERFFRRIVEADVDKLFHPHPFTREQAARIACYDGKDMYYVLTLEHEIVGYGMLRGWDEGFDVPSLGLAIAPSYQGKGFGSLLMHFLHMAARCRGAKTIRLKVHQQNERALAMYSSLGYEFAAEEDGQMVGVLRLT
jgi:ribosomal-protein-alanine N-acetyltransferase